MRKSFLITAVLIAAALGTLLTLAFNQFKLYGRHEQIIEQTEKILFQYSNIREQIIENVVEDRIGDLSKVSPAVEDLHNNLLKILDNKLIPGEYKISFLQQIDLPGLVLLLRKTGTDGDKAILLRRINEESRVIGERFMLFERLVLGHAKQRLVDFQSIIIGILALVVFLVTMLMFVTYRLLIAPVINLSLQSQNLISGRQDEIVKPQGWVEVSVLADKLGVLAGNYKQKRDETARYEQTVECTQDVLKKALVTTDRDVLYQTVCRRLLSHPNFILAWIGVKDPDENEIMPLVVDGSASMSCDECQECFPALLAAQEDVGPAFSSFVKGEPVLMTDVLAHAPKGPFKNTPLAGGKVDSISLPLIYDEMKFGVLTIYINLTDNVLDTEVEILNQMATLIAGKVQSLNHQRDMELVGLERNIVSKNTGILAFTVDSTGVVLTVNSYMGESVYNDAIADWVQLPITDFVEPENESEQIVFRESIKENKRYDFKAKLAGFDEEFSATLEPIPEPSAEQESLLLVLVAPQKNLLLQSDNLKFAFSAAVGQFAGSIAHEITDMSNGIINYAQMMSDEFSDEEHEKRRNLNKIKDVGEKIAAIIEPLLIDQDDLEFTRDMENIQHIFAGVLPLVKYQFKKECISVNLSVQPTSLTFKKQHVQLILLDMFKRIGEELSQNFSPKDEKIIDISVTPFSEEGKKMVVVNFQFPSHRPEEENTETGTSYQNMWLSQELARALGGEITRRQPEVDKGQIELFLPS